MQLPYSAFATLFFKHRIGHGQEYFITTKMKGPLRICVYSLFDNDKIKRKLSILFSSRLRIYTDLFEDLFDGQNWRDNRSENEPVIKKKNAVAWAQKGCSLWVYGFCLYIRAMPQIS